MQCSRPPEPSEFMPADYFRRHSADDIFGNDHPLEIDLGCGDGSFLIEMAQHYPERNFLGVERLLGRVRGVCKRIQELGLTNVMVLRLESQYTLEYLLSSSIRLTPAPALPRPMAQSPAPQTPTGAAGISPHSAKDSHPQRRVPLQNRPPRILRVGVGAEWTSLIKQLLDIIHQLPGLRGEKVVFSIPRQISRGCGRRKEKIRCYDYENNLS